MIILQPRARYFQHLWRHHSSEGLGPSLMQVGLGAIVFSGPLPDPTNSGGNILLGGSRGMLPLEEFDSQTLPLVAFVLFFKYLNAYFMLNCHSVYKYVHNYLYRLYACKYRGVSM